MPSDAYTTTKYKCQKNNYPPKIIETLHKNKDCELT